MTTATNFSEMTLEELIAINKADYLAVSTLIANYSLRDEKVPTRLKDKARELRGILRDYNLMVNARKI